MTGTPGVACGVASLPPIRDTWRVRVPAVGCLVWLLAAPLPAWASDGESAFSVSLGIGTYSVPAEDPDDEALAPLAGGVVGVSYERGISEALSWRVELWGAVYSGDGVSGGGSAAGGLVYRFDVLKYVPYGLLELGVVALDGGPLPEAQLAPVVQIGGGLDILQSRDRSYGVEARLASFAGDVTTVSLSGRYTWRWGYF